MPSTLTVSPDQIDRQVAGGEQSFLALDLVAKRDADARNKLFHSERLGNIVGGTEFEHIDDADQISAAQRDCGLWVSGIVAQTVWKFQPISTSDSQSPEDKSCKV